MSHTILPGITTTRGSDWRAKVAEIEQLGLEVAALFPTVLDLPTRRELYAALEQTPLQRIPHVHLRDDMERWELQYFQERWHTVAFNLHATEAGLQLIRRAPEYAAAIHLENTHSLTPLFMEGLTLCGGLCLDFSHWQDFGRLVGEPSYAQLDVLASRYPIGCCHVSAVVAQGWRRSENEPLHYNRHYFTVLSELSYLTDYRQYLPSLISLELENSLAEQLMAKKYLRELLAL